MLDAYRELIDELLETPTDIRSQLKEQPADDVTAEARRIVAEIRNRDQAVLERVQTMRRQETPYLRELKIVGATGDEDLTTLLEEMETARGELVSILINLSLRDWERAAIDERAGEITLVDEIEEHVEFDEAQRRAFRDVMRQA
ncbi:MAG: hypothetical protein IT338_01075 [Thermomicrobiales bacterium]|nr:hypothetical protein [Thermomicrobiales bacterium]